MPRSPTSPSSLRLPPLISRLRFFTLYETKLRFLLVGSNPLVENQHRILKIDRFSPVDLSLDSDHLDYSKDALDSILAMTQAIKLFDCYGIIGFIRFVSGYYMYCITGIQTVAEVGKHQVYTITDTQLIYIPHSSVDLSSYSSNSPSSTSAFSSFLSLSSSSSPKAFFNPKIEAKYKTLFLLVEMSKDFYFSYTYNITQTLQYNMVHGDYGHNETRDYYVWNDYLLSPLRGGGVGNKYEYVLKDWCVNVIHGYVQQVPISIFGRLISIILISRRSRLFAGTRYLKRGLNDDGNVANDVETEQILCDRSNESTHHYNYTSHVQIRGSIPVHWSQEGSAVVAQPAILIQKLDPLHLSTRNHVAALFERYGSPLLMLNLVKQNESRKRESIVGTAFGEAIDFINQWLPMQHKISFLPWDFKKVAKSKTQSVVDELAVIAHWAVQKTGLFHSFPTEEAVKQKEKEYDNQSSGGLSSLYKIEPTRESLQHFIPNLPERRFQSKAERLLGAFEAASAITMASIRDATEDKEGSPPRAASPVAGLGGDLPHFVLSPSPSTHKKEVSSNVSFNSSLSFSSLSGSTGSPRLGSRVAPAPPMLYTSSPFSSLSPASTTSSPALSPSTPSSTLTPPSPNPPILHTRHVAFIQRGICRSNCIDSLDRTNVAQFVLGKCALGYQLHCLGLSDSQQIVEGNSEIVKVVLDMYERMGDVLAMQYGGSQMHRQMKKDREKTVSMAPVLYKQSQPTKPKEILVSLMRHYQNSFQDTSKQDAINLFLGLFQPQPQIENAIDIWDLQSDYYLHNPHLCSSSAHPYTVEATYLHDDWWKKPLESYERSLLHYSRIALTGLRTISTVDLDDIIHIPTRGRGGGTDSNDTSSQQQPSRGGGVSSPRGANSGNALVVPSILSSTPSASSSPLGGRISMMTPGSASSTSLSLIPSPASIRSFVLNLFFVSSYGSPTLMSSFDDILQDPLKHPRELPLFVINHAKEGWGVHVSPAPLAGPTGVKKGFTTSLGERIRNGLRLRKMKEGDAKGGEEGEDEDKWMEGELWGKREVKEMVLPGTEGEVMGGENPTTNASGGTSWSEFYGDEDEKELERERERDKETGALVIETAGGLYHSSSASSFSSNFLPGTTLTRTKSLLPPPIPFSLAVKNASPSYLRVALKRPPRRPDQCIALPDLSIGSSITNNPSLTALEGFYGDCIHIPLSHLLVNEYQVRAGESLQSSLYRWHDKTKEKEVKHSMQQEIQEKEQKEVLDLLVKNEETVKKLNEDVDGNLYDERFDLDPSFLSEEGIFDISSYTAAGDRACRRKEKQMEELKEIVIEKSRDTNGYNNDGQDDDHPIPDAPPRIEFSEVFYSNPTNISMFQSYHEYEYSTSLNESLVMGNFTSFKLSAHDGNYVNNGGKIEMELRENKQEYVDYCKLGGNNEKIEVLHPLHPLHPQHNTHQHHGSGGATAVAATNSVSLGGKKGKIKGKFFS